MYIYKYPPLLLKILNIEYIKKFVSSAMNFQTLVLIFALLVSNKFWETDQYFGLRLSDNINLMLFILKLHVD